MGIATKFNPLGILPVKKTETPPVSVYYSLTINTTPPNATVTINGAITKTGTYAENTVIQYTVEHEGYLTKSETIILTQDTTLNITLEAINYTVTINPTPSDATVTINGTNQKTITGAYNTTFNWNVSAPYYITQSGVETITKTYTKNVILQEKSEIVPITNSTAGLLLFGNNPSWSNTNKISFTYLSTTSNINYGGVRNSSGIVAGACKLAVSCMLQEGSFPMLALPTGYTYSLFYRLNGGTTDKLFGELKNSTTGLLEGTIELGASDKLTTLGIKFTGSSKASSNRTTTLSINCRKLIA